MLTKELKEKAVAYLKEDDYCQLFETKEIVRTLSGMRNSWNKANPKSDDTEWFVMYHMTLGMAIRNYLREIIPDKTVGGNWDDYYIEVLNAMLDDFDKDGSKENLN